MKTKITQIKDMEGHVYPVEVSNSKTYPGAIVRARDCWVTLFFLPGKDLTVELLTAVLNIHLSAYRQGIAEGREGIRGEFRRLLNVDEAAEESEKAPDSDG